MTRLISDGFELGVIESAWSTSYNNGSGTSGGLITSSPTPRTGVYALRVGNNSVNNNEGRYYRRSFGASLTESLIRFGFHFQYGTSTTAQTGIMRLLDSAGGIQAYMTYKRDEEAIYFYRGDRISAFGGAACALNTTHTIHIRYVTNNASGIVEVYMDNTKVIEFSGDTQQTANANTAAIDIGFVNLGSPSGGNKYAIFDDIAVNDLTGSYQNTMPGNGGMLIFKPNGNGNYSQLVGSDGNSVDNYQLVDEVPASSADYVGSATAGDKDTYAMENVPSPYNAVVFARQVVIASLDSAGSGAIKPILRAGSTDYPEADIALSVGYTTFRTPIRYVHPDGSAWSVSNFNSIENGVEVV